MSNIFTPGLAGDLVRELDYAEQIILVMLRHMPLEQKSDVGTMLARKGIPGQGMTRYHERLDVLTRARAALLRAQAERDLTHVVREENSSGPVFCKNCQYHERSTYPRCNAPAVRKVDLVTGYYGPRCDRERSDTGQCGHEGKLFIARAKKTQSGSGPAPSANNLSSLSMINRASVDSSAITVATATSETSAPNTDKHIARAVSSRS